jgi:hypothetical protein
MSAALSFIDKRQFLTVIQPNFPLRECADPTPAESAEPLHSVADSAATEEATAGPSAVKSAVEPLHSTADPAGSGAVMIKIFCLCVRI